MKRANLAVAIGILALLPLPRVASAQQPSSVAGQWDVTIRMPDKTTAERWTIQQKGKAVTATAKGEREMRATGSVDGAFMRVTVIDSDKQYKVRATVDGDAMDGSITYAPGKEYLWHAKRKK